MLLQAPRRAIVASVTALVLLLMATGTFSAWTTTSSSASSAISSAETYPPPVVEEPPEVGATGPVQEGDELTSTPGSWSGVGGEFTYEWQWQRCDAAGENCVDIPGATGETYTPTPDDVQPGGRTIRVCVTATNMYGSTTICSNPTGVIQAQPAVTVEPPTISGALGAPRENETLSAEGEWSGTPPLEHSYEWLRCDSGGDDCVAIPGATGADYVVGRDDEGSTIRVTVTVSNAALPGGATVSETSPPTGVATVVSDVAEAQYATNGNVLSMVRESGVTYVGGDFSLVGKPTTSFAEIDLADDQAVDMSIAPVTGGDIRAVEPDGFGGWFIGGTFTHVGGLARGYAAHILANGQVDAGWNANVNYVVNDLSVGGSTVYLGGHFSSVGGQTRNRAAGVTAATGALTAWNPNVGPLTNNVFSVLANGATVYIGGSFTTVGGIARSRFAEVTADTGAVTGFNPAPSELVYTMEKVGNILLLGGGFTQVMGTSRLRAAAIDTSTNTLHPWNPSFNFSIFDILVSGPTIYMAGGFSTVNGASHPALIGVDGTGQINWNPPDPSETFSGAGSPMAWTLEVVGSTLYVGGEFTKVGGEDRRGLAAFDTATAALQPWAPQTSAAIYASGVGGGNFYAGGGDVYGNVMLLNALERSNAAAFDSDGLPTDWAPDPSDSVLAMAKLDETIYLGGDFTTAGGQARNRLAAFPAGSSTPNAWNPGANGAVNALATSGSTIYAGGDFTGAGGQGRGRLAAFTAGSSMATSWNPGANAVVHALATSGSTVYAGGAFTAAGGQTRNRLAAFNASGAVTSWNPNANSPVHAIYAAPSGRVYAGGFFTTVGGLTRNRLAAFDPGSSAPTAWNPNASGPIWAIAGIGDNLWVGGFFATVGGQPRSHVAGLRATDGSATDWNPGSDASVRAIIGDSSGIHLGGDFRLMGPRVPQSYAHFK